LSIIYFIGIHTHARARANANTYGLFDIITIYVSLSGVLGIISHGNTTKQRCTPGLNVNRTDRVYLHTHVTSHGHYSRHIFTRHKCVGIRFQMKYRIYIIHDLIKQLSYTNQLFSTRILITYKYTYAVIVVTVKYLY